MSYPRPRTEATSDGKKSFSSGGPVTTSFTELKTNDKGIPIDSDDDVEFVGGGWKEVSPDRKRTVEAVEAKIGSRR